MSTATVAIEQLLTVKDVATLLKLSTRFVYGLEASGALPCIRLGTAVRFRPEDVRAYIDSLARPAATVTPIRETIAAREG